MDDITVSISGTTAGGKIELASSPYGASLRSVKVTSNSGDTHDIILGYAHKADKLGGQGDVLIPFPGRVGGGKYTFDGQDYQMELNDADGPNAIHGFVRKVDWTTESTSAGEVVYSYVLEENSRAGYPFGLKTKIKYQVDSQGVTCTYSIENIGSAPAPVAAGFHPYFTVGDEWVDESILTLPMNTMLEFDDHLIPTGRLLSLNGSLYDFRFPRPIGDLKINSCFCDPIHDENGRTNFTLESPKTGRKVTVWTDQAIAYVVLYTGDVLPDRMRRRGLAIEPMTCGSDAFNHPDWGLVALNPGAVTSGQWGVKTQDA